MTQNFYKLSIAVAGMLLLVGCSYRGAVPLWSTPKPGSDEAQANVRQASSLQACQPEAGTPFQFRKNILVAGTISRPDIARDLPGLAHLTSKRLQTHLDALGRFNLSATHDSSFASKDASTAAHVKQLGREFGSQFVVKVELEDLTVHSSGEWLSGLLGRGVERHAQMRLYVYGTEYGALFHSQRFEGTVSGDVMGYPGNGSTVSAPWFNTEFGRKIDELLIAMSAQVNEKLACVPFSTEVTAIKGSNIHIQAGYLHGIRPGETLRVYRSNELLAPDGTQRQRKVDGWIRVHSVFPNRSIASSASDVDGNDDGLSTGDVVRAW